MHRSALARAPHAAVVAAGALAAALAGAFPGVFPARAEVYDLRVGVQGGRAEIAIVFDAAPTGASAAPGGAGVVVFASGVAASPRRIETTGGSLLRGVDVRQGEGGVELDLALTSEAAAARSWVDGRTLRIAVTLAGAWGDAPSSPSATSPGAPEPNPMSAGAASPPGAGASSQTAMDAAASAAAWLPASPGPSGASESSASSATGAQAASASSPAAPPVQGAPAIAIPVDPAAAAALTARPPADAVYAPALRGAGEGAASSPSAASPEPSDGAADAARAPGSPRDRGRPAVIFAGAITEEECEAADTAVRSDPWDLDSLKRYASCRALDGDPAGAEQAFRRLLTFTPDDSEAELGLAAVRHEQGEVAEAAATYQRLLDNATGDAEGARLRALLALAAAGR